MNVVDYFHSAMLSYAAPFISHDYDQQLGVGEEDDMMVILWIVLVDLSDEISRRMLAVALFVRSRGYPTSYLSSNGHMSHCA